MRASVTDGPARFTASLPRISRPESPAPVDSGIIQIGIVTPRLRARAREKVMSPTCSGLWPSDPSETRTPRSTARRTIRS